MGELKAREAADKAGLEASFERAMENLSMVFQPIVSIHRKGIYGYEAFVRINDPGFPHPGVLLEAAERLERIFDLGRLIRRRVADRLPGLDEELAMFVNLHPDELGDDDLFDPEAPLSLYAPRVVLEITERASLDKIRDLDDRISRLRSLGFRVAIDDLGAGYAGLASFVQLKPEIVKVDMALVRNIHRDGSKRESVRSILALCKEMSIEVVLEGIEVEEEHQVLSELGGDLLQGFRFAKPNKLFTEVDQNLFEV